MFPSASALSEGAMREGFAPRRTRAARFRKRLPLISLSFVRSLTRLGTRLEGLLVRRGGKKKEEEKREKRKKKTKREREKGKAREEDEEDKQRFFYQRGESWLCVWWKSCQERVKKLIIYVNDRSDRIVVACLNAWILAKFQSTLASDWKSAINFEWKGKEERERERGKKRNREFSLCYACSWMKSRSCWWLTIAMTVGVWCNSLRTIFCRFCSGNHVAKDAGICKWTVCVEWKFML